MDLESRDAGLASELVFGCLRYSAQLDFLIDHYAGRPAKTEPGLRVAMWMGIYQLRYLDRIPRHAAVDESVELAKRGGKRFAAGFVNAVLRKVTRAEVSFGSKSVELCCPQWILDRWTNQYGAEAAEKIALAALKQPETWVRFVQPLHPLPNLEPAEVPGSWRLAGGSVPPGARIQDIGSQSIVPLLDLKEGETFLDVCAAPGGKTLQAMEAGVKAIAADINPERLLAVRGCPRVALDASRELPFSTTFDAILVDAPCSGTGTLDRNPEIKLRLEPGNIKELHSLQVAILNRALDKLAPAGRLVYSTCSLEKEENQDVVAEVLATRGQFRMVKEMTRLPGRDLGDGFYAAVLTSEHPVNG